MVQYLESTRNYFYKQYKNGKKKRISFELYNSCVMKGGEWGGPAESDTKSKNLTNSGPAESGDKKFDLTIKSEFMEFYSFFNEHFIRNNRNTNNDYDSMKRGIQLYFKSIIEKDVNYFSNTNNDYKKKNIQVFYIYDNNQRKIIFIGMIRDFKIIDDFCYKNILYLLRCPNTFGAGKQAIYHILDKLPSEYRGICLESIPSAVGFYKKCGFRKIDSNDDYTTLFVLDKGNKEKLQQTIRNSVENTELVSTFGRIY